MLITAITITHGGRLWGTRSPNDLSATHRLSPCAALNLARARFLDSLPSKFRAESIYKTALLSSGALMNKNARKEAALVSI